MVENGVDVERFAAAGKSSSARSRKLLFVGSMDYFPNVEAATSFAQSVWPVLRQTFPELSFWIVGANPLPAVQALAALPGIHVTGTVPSVQPYYGDALAAVVPLKTGGGTRLKILEAMAAGIPVISTPLGAEGLAVQNGRNILLADPGNTALWVDHVRTLMDSEERWISLTGTGRQLVQSHYDWSALGTKLCQFYQEWAAIPGIAS